MERGLKLLRKVLRLGSQENKTRDPLRKIINLIAVEKAETYEARLAFQQIKDPAKKSSWLLKTLG